MPIMLIFIGGNFSLLLFPLLNLQSRKSVSAAAGSSRQEHLPDASGATFPSIPWELIEKRYHIPPRTRDFPTTAKIFCPYIILMHVKLWQMWELRFSPSLVNLIIMNRGSIWDGALISRENTLWVEERRASHTIGNILELSLEWVSEHGERSWLRRGRKFMLKTWIKMWVTG